uniref:CSON014735 protein n=1 Tax=Culicoides sonorensis TaxID=179676 RepID=A0A336MH80_CULSO
MVAISSVFFLFWLKLLFSGVSCSMEGEMMSLWAEKFGEELWELGEKMTKAQEIKLKYKQLNARVEKKDGETLLESIADNVGRMLQRKMDSIRCVVLKAEEVSEQFEYNETVAKNFEYYSSKYSPIAGEDFDPDELWPDGVVQNNDTYKVMYFYQDTHFFNISVNTTHSSVQVPTNVYDRSTRVLEALQWSEQLDDVFVQNYNSDPALSWQYFGSDTGFLRHYPAMSWNRKEIDVFDCRKRSWFIETATCSKDVVILLDNSGSMTGYRNYIAQLTIKNLLDTFSNNDFVNIFNFSSEVSQIIPCFGDKLVQATPENIKVFNEAVRQIEPEGHANHRIALTFAFELLEQYREIRGCHNQGCNQAIMLITDGIPENLTDIFDKYNNFENGTNKPVRMFAYLLGKEVTKVQEIQSMACLNRGLYSHIQSLDQVSEEVLKYVNVIAMPLVLQGTEHPPTWTHAFLDPNWSPDDDSSTQDSPRLMIAVGAPAFDRKLLYSNDTKTVSKGLLGVAGTDISVEELDRLTLPYKLGVNAYSFIISNNGYVLLHPELKPVYKGHLKDNYNSIDLVEIEQVDDDNQTARNPDPTILDLRQRMVNNEKGEMLNVPVRFHYDNMRRISQERQDYYYAPLPNTPFSLAIALPSDYGSTWIKVGDEVKKNQHMGLNVSDFFVGENWKIHPGWVYCKYHYLEGHEFKTPEDELKHFLTKMGDPSWYWAEQYAIDPNDDDEFDSTPNCGRSTLDESSYYCNKELVQLLVFDAKVTNNSYQTWKFANKEEQDLIESYNASLRFVATMSGLTRWQFIFGEVEVENDREFGDYHTKAIDETWYRAAVLQHKLDPHSFFYSVQHSEDEKEEGGLKVTASMAIFPRDGGLEAPSCVCDGCIRTCDQEEVDCYVIDNNGYIILADNDTTIGSFLGEVEGEIIRHLVDEGIFKKIITYDLQALCVEMRKVDGMSNDGPYMITPFRIFTLGLQWILGEILQFLSKMQLFIEGTETLEEYYDQLDDDYPAEIPQIPEKKPKKQETVQPQKTKYEPHFYSCDNSSTLYILQQNNPKIGKGNNYYHKTSTEGSKPYFIKRIPRSNLLLVVVNSSYPSEDPYYKETTEPVTINYIEPFPCHKLNLNDLPRRRLEECFTEHPEEEEFAKCSLGIKLNSIQTVFVLIISVLALWL